MTRSLYIFCMLMSMTITLFSQSLPTEWKFSNDGKRLLKGGHPSTGLYLESVVDTMELIFPQTNYLTLLASNYTSGTPILATLKYKGKTYDSVGVNYKGLTSYGANTSQKKSFNITLDWVKSDQDIKGYKTLNLNCNYDDPSATREVLYNHTGRNYIPGLKSNYIYLFVNGAPWALYTNTQQLDGSFIRDWCLSNDGIRWRAIKPTPSSPGPVTPGGNPFGAGKSSLNYLGDDTTLYKSNYTLKSSKLADPWQYLIDATRAIDQMPVTVQPDSLGYYIDVDKVLWFLAHEIVFGDDDSYVFKGGMDYFVYYEPESGTLFPLEYDGNTAFSQGGSMWSPFYREADTKFPLCNKLFRVPEFRQRYLAHLRVIIEDYLNPSKLTPQIDSYKTLIDPYVQAEPKRIYSYTQFVNGVSNLKTWISNRYTFLNNNAEVKQVPPTISSVTRSVGSVQDKAPTATDVVIVNAKAEHSDGLHSVWLYYSDRLVGRFSRLEMFDDGAHDDGAAQDGIYGGKIPAHNAGTYVRYYVEARANNTARSAAFFPAGAEHDVFIYQVQFEVVAGDVVINEVVASNVSGAVDEKQQTDDWIELFNKGNSVVNISGYHITDKVDNLNKWKIPQGTQLLPGEYLILWCDEDSSQGKFHVNFKLSKSGETVLLTSPQQSVLDQVTFGAQQDDKAYARRPNGTGNFVIQAPTFRANNDFVDTHEPTDIARFVMYPNPGQGDLTIRAEGTSEIKSVRVFDAHGREVARTPDQLSQEVGLELSHLPAGLYFIRINDGQVIQKLVKM